MERPVNFKKGDIITISFPFADLSGSKKRPALVLAAFEGDDVLLCQITATRKDRYAIHVPLHEQSGLHRESYVRPQRLFTASTALIIHRIGRISQNKLNEIEEAIVGFLTI